MPDERASSQNEEPIFSYLQRRIEAVHEEAKVERAAQRAHNTMMDTKVAQYDLLHQQHKDALNAGNAKFSSLTVDADNKHKALEAKIAPRWSTIGSVILALGGVIWMASRYPDAEKFEALRDQVSTMRERQNGFERDIAEIKKDIARTENTMNSINGKLDKLILSKVTP